jgi:hypothetical protein
VLDLDGGRRVVRASDVEPEQRPSRGRVIAGTAAFVVTALVALTVFGSAGVLGYNVLFWDQIQAANETTRQEKDPKAQEACDSFVAELLRSGPDGVSKYAVDNATYALPRYRKHLRESGVMRLASEGYATSGNQWEYMYRESGPASADHTPCDVSITVQERDGRFVVTGLDWSPAD